MRLGNSNGQNTGKRYIKLTGNERIAPERELAVGLFSQWMERNYVKLRRSIVGKGVYDDDVFSDTCQNMYDAIAFKQLDIKCYGSYFNRSYFTNKMLDASRETKRGKVHYDVTAAWNVPDQKFGYSISVSDVRRLNHDIFEYVNTSYSPTESSLFEIYVQARSALSYKELSKITRMPYYSVATTLSGIFRDVRQTFSDRKSELVD